MYPNIFLLQSDLLLVSDFFNIRQYNIHPKYILVDNWIQQQIPIGWMTVFTLVSLTDKSELFPKKNW